MQVLKIELNVADSCFQINSCAYIAIVRSSELSNLYSLGILYLSKFLIANYEIKQTQ